MTTTKRSRAALRAIEATLPVDLVDAAYKRAVLRAWHNGWLAENIPGAEQRFDAALLDYAAALSKLVAWPIGGEDRPVTPEEEAVRAELAARITEVETQLELYPQAQELVARSRPKPTEPEPETGSEVAA